MPDQVYNVIWEGSFTILGVTLRCYVLDDERHSRVINGEDLARLFEAMGDENCPPLDGLVMEKFVKWQKGIGAAIWVGERIWPED